jgi:abortive infection bacteriophage resistance protein
MASFYFHLDNIRRESWLQTLSNVRNICTHYGRLYNKKLTFKPRIFKEEDNILYTAVCDNGHSLIVDTDNQ